MAHSLSKLSISPSPLQPIHLSQQWGLRLFCKRDDQLHPLLSGNKWRKLKYSLRHAQQTGARSLLSFGGAYSNHLHALAAAGALLGFQTTGIVRGSISDATNPTLADLRRFGMTLHAVSREQYRLRHQPEVQQQLAATYHADCIIPEGGTCPRALTGVSEIVDELPTNMDIIVTAVGSGGTLAGLLLALKPHQRIWAVQVSRDRSLLSRIKQLLGPEQHRLQQVTWLTAGFDDRFGRFDDSLVNAMQRIWQQHQLPLEPIYTAKMFTAFEHHLHHYQGPSNATIVLLHTGGLQGLNGLIARGLINAEALPYWPMH